MGRGPPGRSSTACPGCQPHAHPSVGIVSLTGSHTHTHTHACTHARTHAHTHTHTHTQPHSPLCADCPAGAFPPPCPSNCPGGRREWGPQPHACGTPRAPAHHHHAQQRASRRRLSQDMGAHVGGRGLPRCVHSLGMAVYQETTHRLGMSVSFIQGLPYSWGTETLPALSHAFLMLCLPACLPACLPNSCHFRPVPWPHLCPLLSMPPLLFSLHEACPPPHSPCPPPQPECDPTPPHPA